MSPKPHKGPVPSAAFLPASSSSFWGLTTRSAPPQLAAGPGLAPRGRGIPPHLRPGLGPARRLQRLQRLRHRRRLLQPPQRGRPQRRAAPSRPLRVLVQVRARRRPRRDVHIYIYRDRHTDGHTASIFIYLTDHGGVGPAAGRPRIPQPTSPGEPPVPAAEGTLARPFGDGDALPGASSAPPAPLQCQGLAGLGCLTAPQRSVHSGPRK